MNNKYFPTKSDCICTLNSLNPNNIKEYYKKELTTSNIKPKQFYIEVSKLLGFKSWDNYQKSYQTEILPFIQQNGLVNYAPNIHDDLNINILQSEHGILQPAHDISFNYQKLSDRLFLSNQPYPQSIFTGYDCRTDFIHYYYKTETNIFTGEFVIPDISKENYNQLLQDNDMDLLIPVTPGSFMVFSNLLGDAFFKYDDNYKYNYIFEEYLDYQGLNEHESHNIDATRFHNTILELEKGWIEIIPFNDNLVFLKASNGNYDFIFKGIKDNAFISPYSNFIKHENIPTLLNEDYDFERWLYYGFKKDIKNKKDIKPLLLWKEMDNHKSEINFYKSNKQNSYTSPSKILKDYYQQQNKYSYDKKITTELIDGFQSIKIDNKILNVSNLITIKEFNEFYKEKYGKTRSDTLDEIFTVNDYDDDNYPVSVTWYDAIAYCKYLEVKYNIPARLITSLEYKDVSPKRESPQEEKDFKTLNEYLEYIQSKDYQKNHNPYSINTKEELIFSYDGKEFDGAPPRMSNFSNVIMRYKKQIEFIESNNIKFPEFSSFVEWTNDFRSNHAKVISLKFANSSQESKLLASSNNKYKYLKVGFRVCYEMDNNNVK
ncbi:MAG: hypothetical protein DRG78_00065 [Epsilonproteobacteria bacterium]|nr:MAG: hypothetical protein DRG78_00065 [Campylobacterota bacterium]